MSFMKPEYSFSFSQEPPTHPHRDENEFIPQHRILFRNFDTTFTSTAISSKKWFLFVGLYH
jgi:hypothetical protein